MKCRFVFVWSALFVALAIPVAAQDQSHSEDRRERLTAYLRDGRYGDARRLIDEMLEDGPRDDLENVRAIFGDAPNVRVRRGSARFRCEVQNTGVVLPVTIDGTRANWLVDTGANVTTISDAEAIRLGLVIRDSEGIAQDSAGGRTGVRTTRARRMLIGRTQLQDVPMLVMPADRMPWKELPPGRQGIIGLPVVIALEALRWTRAAQCHTGSQAAGDSAPASANLLFDGLHVIAKADFEGRPLEFVLDTGNQAGTQLWERFAADFAALVEAHGTKGTVQVTQMGGSTERETIVVPDLRLKVGGMSTTLVRGNIFSKPVGDARFHGLLGMDVLSQATEVTIDFRAMTLSLR